MGILQKEFSASGTEADGTGQVSGDFLIGDKKIYYFCRIEKNQTLLYLKIALSAQGYGSFQLI